MSKSAKTSGSEMLTIGCKLPHGIVLEDPTPGSVKTVELNGLNKIIIIGATYAATQVPADFWAAWQAFHGDFPALKSGAIFVAQNEVDAAAMAKELENETTGFEPMKKNGKDKRAAGVKTASAENDPKD